MTQLVYTSSEDEQADIPALLAAPSLHPANRRCRVRVVGSTVYVSGAVTSVTIDRVCAAVDHLHAIGASNIRVEMDDAVVPAAALGLDAVETA